MKYTLDTTTLSQFPALLKRLGERDTRQIHIGLDAEQACCAVAVIVDGATPIYLGKQTRDTIVALCAELVAKEHTVALAQEACGFGYEFHRQLLASGAQSVVVAPEALNGKRKTDKADSRKLARDLYSYLSLDNRDALRPIRIPDLSEQQLRALYRERAQAMKLRNQAAAQARSLAVSFGIVEVPVKWWGVRKWPLWRTQLEQADQHWIIERLEAKVPVIRQFDEQLRELDELTLQEAFRRDAAKPAPKSVVGEAAAPAADAAHYQDELLMRLPKGLGVRTHLNLSAEICDWGRFGNRRQIGSYAGMCPSEYSSGPNQKLGSIDRMGNASVRTMLVEAAWRMVRYQPKWRGLKKFLAVLGKGAKASKTARRKAIVAVARLLAVDLWRVQTGRCTLEELGFAPAASAQVG